jgi:two-component system chemotaxis response regulator CheY
MLNDNPSPYSRSLHILVVDDIASMRRVMCSLLRDELRAVRITEAADGDSALKILEAAESDGTPVDFVVTDWNMPHMDGIELLKAIREMEPMRHLPVLMVTAQATKDMILAAAH